MPFGFQKTKTFYMNLSLPKTYYKFLFIAVLFAIQFSFAQTTIENQTFRGGALPSGWSQTAVTFTTSADGYANFTTSAAQLISPVYNLTGYTNVKLSFSVAKFGTGGDGPLTVDVSNDGGLTWTAQTFNSGTPTSATYVSTTEQSITVTGSNVRIRIRRINSASQKRFRDYLLVGTASQTVPTVTGGTVNGTVGTAVNYQIVASNTPSSYAISNGTLPNGLSLNTTSGVISGTPTTAGSSSVQVTATNGAGTSTPASLNFVIAKSNQTITFNALANRQYGDANFNLTATASSGLAVSYASSNPLVATISGNTVTILGEGTTNITASQTGNTNFNAAANVIRTLTVTKRQLTITGLTGTNKIYDATTTASATGTATLNNILAGDESNVSLDGTPSFAFVTATVGVGKMINTTGFTLSGSSAGNYILVQPTLTADISVKPITVTGATANDKVYDGNTTATIVGGTLNGVEAADVANVSLASTGSFDTANAGENKPVTLSISGSAASNYSLTQPGITASITKANQTITFDPLPPLNINSLDLNLNEYASASSGLALSYESSNPAVVSVSGNTLTVVGAGTAIITASQVGNTNFNPAVNVTQSVTVTLAPSVIAGWDFQTTTNGGTALVTAPNTPKQITANFGSGVLYLDGTNFSSDFVTETTGNELTAFGGTSVNTVGTSFSTSASGAAALAVLGGTSNSANGKSLVFVVNMANYSDLGISYAAQRTGSGFTNNNWEYSTDGFVWASISTITTIPSSFGIISLPVISGLDNVSTAYIRLTINGATNSTGNNRLDNIKFEATAIPITEVTWNGTEWSNINVPNATLDAIIAGDYVTATHEEFTAKKLTVTSGSLTVSSGTSITVEDVLENELTAAAIVVENNANLIQSNDVNNIGSITVQRNSSDIMRLDYTLWSSPVAGQNLLNFSPTTLPNRFYVYNPSNNQYAMITPSTNSFTEGTGYLIRSAANHPLVPTSWEATFVGEPHNGDVTISVSNNTYNAVGNPYPSTISANAFITENSLTEALYFWRKTNGATGSAYATYTFAGGAGTGGSGSDSEIPNGTIQVGQGFIARATSNSLVFTNEMRTANHSNQFFRNSSDSDRNRIWLNISNAQNLIGQTMIAYMENTSLDFDAMYDGKYINDSQTAFTSLIGNQEYAVQARGSYMVTDVVPMSFKTEAAGTYTISLAHVDGLFETEEDIFVKDNLAGIEHDLRDSAYQFTSESGVFANRFEIVYQSTLGVTVPEFANQTIVFAKDNFLNVRTGSSIITGIQVFDVQGRLVLDAKNINATSYTTSLNQISNGVLLVKVFSDNGQSTIKKIIK